MRGRESERVSLHDIGRSELCVCVCVCVCTCVCVCVCSNAEFNHATYTAHFQCGNRYSIC